MDAQTELVAQQTATMALAKTIIDMAVGLVRNTDDIRLLEAVLDTLREQVGTVTSPFVLPEQPPLDSAREEAALALYREKARVMTEFIEMACQARLGEYMGLKN